MKKLSENYNNEFLIKKILIILLLAYSVLSVLFYILAGEQLYFRSSKGNIKEVVPTSQTIELFNGNSVSETFINNIQIMEGFSIGFADYNRINQGKISVVLTDLTDGSVLLNNDIDVSGIKEGKKTNFNLSEPLEGKYNHKMAINIIGLDGVEGTSVTPLMRNEKKMADTQLYFDNQPVDGTLCFSTNGKDHVWLGSHYWKFVLSGGLLIVAWSCLILYKSKNNKKTMILNVIISIQRYKFLIQQMVSRDFKTKYKRSVLGIFWSFLNPLLMMLVQYFVFSNIFKNDIPNYHVYLLIGVVMFNFFSESCGMTLSSILGNANLLTKVYVPKYIYPLARVASSSVNLLISLIPLLLIIIFSDIIVTKAIFLTIFALVCLIVFCLGLGLILSTSMVFFRDTQFLWSIFSMIWMYLTPVFYPETILPENIVGVLKFNPLYYYIKFVRSCVLDGVSPEPRTYFICAMCSIIMFVLGAWIFKKNQDKFIFYL